MPATPENLAKIGLEVEGAEQSASGIQQVLKALQATGKQAGEQREYARNQRPSQAHCVQSCESSTHGTGASLAALEDALRNHVPLGGGTQWLDAQVNFLRDSLTFLRDSRGSLLRTFRASCDCKSDHRRCHPALHTVPPPVGHIHA